MQSRSMEHSLSLAISFFSIVISIICVQRYKQLLRKTHSVAHFRPKTKNNIHYWGKMELMMKSMGDISMKPDADIVMRKLAQNPSFCGLQKLNTLNLYSFCPSQNPRRHFSTV